MKSGSGQRGASEGVVHGEAGRGVGETVLEIAEAVVAAAFVEFERHTLSDDHAECAIAGSGDITSGRAGPSHNLIVTAEPNRSVKSGKRVRDYPVQLLQA